MFVFLLAYTFKYTIKNDHLFTGSRSTIELPRNVFIRSEYKGYDSLVWGDFQLGADPS